jgi:ribulose-phosphate 3-epimerase
VTTASARAEPHISASILNADFAALGADVRRAEAGGVDSIHLDVMDGHFVDNLTMGPVVVDALRNHSRLPYHSHLMISRPLRYVDAFATAGSDLIVAHVEADDDVEAVISAVRAAGKQVGLAINPGTPAEAVHPYLERIDLVLAMTVNPGFGGQSFIPAVLPKIRRIRDMIGDRPIDLEVDGGVTPDTAGKVVAAGANVLVAGSALFRGGPEAYAGNISALRQAAEGV